MSGTTPPMSRLGSRSSFDRTDKRMPVALFSSQSYDKDFFCATIERTKAELNVRFLEAKLTEDNVPLAQGAKAVCVFVNDELPADVLEDLHDMGVEMIALRCAGYNNVDLDAAQKLELTITHVPAYSPHAVAEHAVALIMELNRKIFKVVPRVRDGNFSLQRLPWGFDVHGKTVGVLGTGKIGQCFMKIMKGFGCRVVGYDMYPNQKLVEQGILDEYADNIDDVLKEADIVSLHMPLTKENHHVINDQRLAVMKKDAVLINTSRGGLVDTVAVIKALKSKHLGALGVDVYEEEANVFYNDCSNSVIGDDVLMRLLTFPNVIVTPHQAFFTQEALQEISSSTIHSLGDFHADPSKPTTSCIMHKGQFSPNFKR